MFLFVLCNMLQFDIVSYDTTLYCKERGTFLSLLCPVLKQFLNFTKKFKCYIYLHKKLTKIDTELPD